MKHQRSEKLLKHIEQQKEFERLNPTEKPKIKVMRRGIAILSKIERLEKMRADAQIGGMVQ